MYVKKCLITQIHKWKEVMKLSWKVYIKSLCPTKDIFVRYMKSLKTESFLITLVVGTENDFSHSTINGCQGVSHNEN